jgi:hypothetical protein
MLGASLDGLLGQHDDLVLPATLVSLLLFMVNLGLLGYALHLDRYVRTYDRADARDSGHQKID